MTHGTDYPAVSGGPAPAPPPALPPEPPVPRRLHRSRRDRVFGGVCGGLAEYFGVDAVLVRIVAVALALSGGAGFLLYFIAWIAIPEGSPGEAGTSASTTPVYGPAAEADRVRSRAAAVTVAGAALVALGVLMLLNRVLPWVDAALLWPLIVVGAGVAILTSGRRRS
jgi:phage shock protein C